MSGLFAIDFKRDVLDPLVDKALPNVVAEALARKRLRSQRLLLALALRGVGEQVPRVLAPMSR